VTYETRFNQLYSFGTLTGAASASDTTLSSNDFAALPPGLSTTTYIPITLQDPSLKVCEVVWVNSHASGAATVTATRGREATTARAWPSGTLWTVTPTLRDGVLPVASRAALPSDPHVGLRCYLQDEQLIVEWILGVGWVGTAAGATYRGGQVLAVDTPSIVVSSIPTTLKKLVVHWVARSTNTSGAEAMIMRINGAATATYYTTMSWQSATTPGYQVDWAGTGCHCGWMTGANAAVNNWGAGEIVLPGWNAPGNRGALSFLAQSHYIQTQADTIRAHNCGEWVGSGPYTSLTFVPAVGSFRAGTEILVYGYA
jgi:hypothetical protein